MTLVIVPDSLRDAINTTFGLPNLDGLSIDPTDYQEASRVFLLYAKYAKHKSIAMRLRANGNIAQAEQFESICEYIYGEMPEWARW